ncbi:Nucleolar Complex 2 protein [Imshaugia aleurites]|uniref:Nucleolar Complex 2 protein n=1 Tax=Imshaugia aleurites TaxID=172621 RepID=A0A8H3FBY7_9LECA|nr:Nucleolar Complex 2 protein [Imshaugia aleurites]
MPGRAKKSTKKFEKNHLKDAIDKRKDVAKIKQRHQIKTKKQARNAADKARAPDIGDKSAVPAKADRSAAADLSKMSVDEFFQGGFDLPEQKKKGKKAIKTKDVPQRAGKRKREEEEDDSDGSVPDIGSPSTSNDEMDSNLEDGLEAHKGDLDALAEKDPEFYKYLKENDTELLDFNEDADLVEVDQLSEEEKAPKKKRKKSKDKKDIMHQEAEDDESEVTTAMIRKWKTAMVEQHSLRAMRQTVLAFRAAAYVNSDDGKEHKYSISSPDVYNELLLTALEHVPNVLSHHLPAKESASGKVRIATDSKKYRTLTPLLKSHSSSIHYLLENLSDAPTMKMTLLSLIPLLPYLLSFKKVLKNLIKTTVNIWSDTSTDEATRITSFMLIRRLAVISDASLREAILKTTYQGLVRGSRITNIHTLPGINLMKNSAAELWGLDPNIGYTTGFTYIRQLAVHLRTSITHPTKDSYKTIYNWQYTHSLDFWSRVLSTHCSNPLLKSPSASPLHPLIYPLVQITLGALRLIPTPTYFPLRFHLTRSLLRVSRTTSTYIPLVPSLLEVLSSPDLSKPPKPSTLPPLDFSIALRAPKSYLRTRIYQDGLGQQVQELLAEFFGCWAKHIAFPELIIPPTVALKRWLKSASSPPSKGNKSATSKAEREGKGNKNAKLNSSISLLLQKMSANAQYVEGKRAAVSFGPSDRQGVDNFLRDVPVEETPLGAFVDGLRRQKEERERVLSESRREDEARRANGKKGEGNGDTEMLDGVEQEKEEEGSDSEDD